MTEKEAARKATNYLNLSLLLPFVKTDPYKREKIRKKMAKLLHCNESKLRKILKSIHFKIPPLRYVSILDTIVPKGTKKKPLKGKELGKYLKNKF
mgnify:CR=1 FL=1